MHSEKESENTKDHGFVRKTLIPTVILFALWLVLSGHYTKLLIGLGLLTSFLLARMGSKFGVLDPSQHSVRLFARTLTYIPWLVKEIVKSNIEVTRQIWQFPLHLKPRVFWTKANQENDKALVIYANSITLTPGTISINSRPGQIQVHALDEEGEIGLNEGEMNQRVTRLEKN
ncbi:MAG: Na+/H+ antiporter subunit E [Verrucomicrobiota bacterium]